MKTFDYVACGDYFVFFEEKLQKVRLYSIRVYPEGDELWYDVEIAGRTVSLCDKERFYDSEEDFFRGIETKNRSLIDDNRVSIDMNCRAAENGNFIGWVLYDTIEEIEFKIVDITIRDDDHVYGCIDSFHREVHGKVYKTRQELLDNNIIKVIDESGNEREVVGINLKLRLSDEQRQLVDEMVDLVIRMEKAGLRLVYNQYNGTLSTFNTSNIDDYDYAFRDDSDDFDRVLDYKDLTDIVDLDYQVDDYNVIGIMENL